MKNQYTRVMSEKTDSDLEKIVTIQSKSYLPETIEAAQQEIKKRKDVREKLLKYSNEQILTILKPLNPNNHFELEVAFKEAEKRNLNFDFYNAKTEMKLNNEVYKLKIGVSREKYHILKTISSLFSIISWIVIIAAAINFIYMLSLKETNVPISIGVFLGGCISFITLLAFSNIIKLFIDIEYNTRISATKRF